MVGFGIRAGAARSDSRMSAAQSAPASISDVVLIEVLPQHRIDEAALWRYLSSALPDFSGPAALRQFQGGQSNPTYLIETPAKKFVLRKKPPGKLLPSAHLIEREYRILRSLPGDFPKPAARLLCEDARRYTTITRASPRSCTASIFAPAGCSISASPKVTSRASWSAGASNIWPRRRKRTRT
jgi:hypothetical protein